MQREYAPLIEEFVRLLVEEFGDRVVSVLLFGSVARETARPDSDIDVCLVIRDLPASRYRRHQLLTPLLEKLRQTALPLEIWFGADIRRTLRPFSTPPRRYKRGSRSS